MKTLHLTPGDQTAMLRASTDQALGARDAIVEAMTSHPPGALVELEDTLAVAALAILLRGRVERAAKDRPGLAAMLRRLDGYVAERHELAERIAEEREERGAGEVARG